MNADFVKVLKRVVGEGEVSSVKVEDLIGAFEGVEGEWTAVRLGTLLAKSGVLQEKPKRGAGGWLKGWVLNGDAVRALEPERKVGGAGVQKHVLEVLPDMFRPFAVKVATPHTAPTIGKPWTELIMGDSHMFPGQDSTVVDIALQIITDLQPDGVTHDGDLLECYRPSHHEKNPYFDHTLQAEVDMGRTFLSQVATAAPGARRKFCEGNHEDRLTRLVWGLEGVEKAFFELDLFREQMTWPKILHLDEIGWEFIPYREQPALYLPKFLVKHGTRVNANSGYTAKAEHADYGMSGASGHSHRLAAYMQADYNGAHLWLETGCTCSRTSWYGTKRDANWHQGFWVVTFDVETGAFAPEMVFVVNGYTIFRGNEYRAQ